MDFLNTLQNVSVLFLLIVIGFLVGKLNIVSVVGQKELAQLVLKVTMPATIILAMQQPFSTDKISNILQLIAIMIVAYAFIISSCLLFPKFIPNLAPNQRDIVSTSILLSNTSFMGYPIVLTLLGEEYLFYAVICGGFVFEVVAWTLGMFLVRRNVRTEVAVTATSKLTALKKAVINPGVISILIGGSLFLTRIKIPEPIFSTMTVLGRATSPLAMLVVGMILSRTAIREAITNKVVYGVAAMKLVVNPLIITSVLMLLGYTGFNRIIPVVLLAMPTAAYVAMFSEQAGNDAKLASQIVFITSLASLITIPLITGLL